MRRLATPSLPAILFFAFPLFFAGCAGCGQSAICSMKDTINAPQSRTMRRNLMANGLQEFCRQMLLRSTTLRMDNDLTTPSMGRFFPTECQKVELDNGDINVRFFGIGYAHTNITRKVTFQMAGTVQYNQDFQVSDDCDIYAYFRPRQIGGENFQIKKIEQQTAAYFNSMSNMGEAFGKNLLSTRLREGFTVIHDREEHDAFSLGILSVGQKPEQVLRVSTEGRVPYENQRVEVHQNQREFIGPIEVRETGKALYLNAKLDGGVPLDVFVFTQAVANPALLQYIEVPQVQAIAGQPLLSDAIAAQMGYQKVLPVAPGLYYVVFDNSTLAGSTSPPFNPNEDRAALVDYAIQIGDVP
jgi:hypothetical protein